MDANVQTSQFVPKCGSGLREYHSIIRAPRAAAEGYRMDAEGSRQTRPRKACRIPAEELGQDAGYDAEICLREAAGRHGQNTIMLFFLVIPDEELFK